MGLEPNIPGATESSAPARPSPGLNVRGVGIVERRKRRAITQHDVSHCNRLSFFVHSRSGTDFNPIGKVALRLLDEFGPAREYPVHAAYTVERNIHLVNPHSQAISFSYELPIPEIRTDFGTEFGFESADGTFTYPVVTLQEIAGMMAKVDGGSNHVMIPLAEEYLGAMMPYRSVQVPNYWPPVGQNNGYAV